jgi:hypothetical protein
VVVVADGVCAEVNVVVCRRRAADNQRADHTIAVLVGVVAMVPRCPVLGDMESVRLAVSRWDGALGDAVCSVLVAFAKLPDAMPVDRGPALCQQSLSLQVHVKDFRTHYPACRCRQ